MASYTDSKAAGEHFPAGAKDTEHSRNEPILSPKQLRDRFFAGFPLVSQLRDPISGKQIVITDSQLTEFIETAVQEAELLIGIDIFPVQHEEKFPFDRNLYESYGYFRLPHRPVTSIEKLSVTPSNGFDIYSLPLDWVETKGLVKGQLNIIPMTAAFIQGGYIPSGPTGGAFFLAMVGNRGWVPYYWQITYTAGYKDGMVPRVINELVGCIAAQNILSQLAITHAMVNSSSLGIDGMSQSVSGPGPQVFTVRIQELEERRKRIVSKVKAHYGLKLYSSTL